MENPNQIVNAIALYVAIFLVFSWVFPVVPGADSSNLFRSLLISLAVVGLYVFISSFFSRCW